mgnify:CR=1 FL=1
MRVLVLKFLICFFLFSAAISTPAAAKDNPHQQCENFLIKGRKAKEEGEYIKALEYFTQAEVLAENYQIKEKLFDIKNNIGVVYVNLSNYNEALGYYLQALELAKTATDDSLSMVLNNIGNLYSNMKDYRNALKYYKTVYNDPEKKEDYTRTFIAINISDNYNKLGDFEEARKYLLEVKDTKKAKKVEQVWKANYAETFLLEGKIDVAEEMMLEALKDEGLKKDNDSYVYIVELLSRIYTKKNQPDLAILYAKKGLEYTSKLKERINLYNEISGLYLKKGEAVHAMQYKDSVIKTKDAIAGLINKEFLETTKIRLKAQRYENELKISKEKYSAERNLYIIAIVFSLVLSFLVYKTLKGRILKQKQEKIIADNQQKIVELEMDNLKNNIGEKNRKLTAKALYVSGRNELIVEIINSLTQFPEISKNKEVSSYIKTLKDYIRTDDEWDEFTVHFEKVNPGLLKTLTTKHPGLTAKDLRFLCYVYMNLDAKELAIVFNITPDACRRRERRLLQKMNLDTDVSLFQYLLEIG